MNYLCLPAMYMKIYYVKIDLQYWRSILTPNTRGQNYTRLCDIKLQPDARLQFYVDLYLRR